MCLCVSVCLSVCHHVCGEMAALSNMVSSHVNTIYHRSTRNCNTCQDDPFPDPDNMDQPDHITFWLITSKLIYGFTPNFMCVDSTVVQLGGHHTCCGF